ncbi:MAG: ATP-binding cassette domain-containing protein [Pseudomonadota bacterium]
MLVCQSVTKKFGALAAVEDLSFELEQGLVLGIGGPNGAGKTTLFDVISGLQPITSGKVILDNHDISKSSPDRICHLGLARTFQLNAAFDSMTGRENVQVAAYFGRVNRLFPGLRLDKETVKRTEAALDMVGMRERAGQPVESAPVLDRKLLMIAGAVVTEPKLLLMDEPVGGLTPDEIDEVEAVVARVVQELKTTVILIEHVMRFLMRLSDRVLIMHHGSKLFEGLPREVAANDEVIEVYLGKGAKARSQHWFDDEDKSEAAQ